MGSDCCISTYALVCLCIGLFRMGTKENVPWGRGGCCCAISCCFCHAELVMIPLRLHAISLPLRVHINRPVFMRGVWM